MVRLTHINEDWYQLRLPDISRKGHPLITGMKITERQRVGVWGAAMIDDNLLVQAEVLAFTDNGVSFLIGLCRIVFKMEPNKPNPKEVFELRFSGKPLA